MNHYPTIQSADAYIQCMKENTRLLESSKVIMTKLSEAVQRSKEIRERIKKIK